MAIYIVLVWLLFVALLSLLCSLTMKKGGSSTWTLPPGPRKLPVIGNLHQLGRLPHKSLWQLSQRYGPLMHLRLGRMPTLVVASAEMAREVMKSHDLDFCSRPRLVAFSKVFYNGLDIAFSPYSDYWREVRRICILELFGPKRVQSFRSIREEEVSAMIGMIAASSPTPVINLSKMTVTLANNITCRIAFGKKLEGGEYRKGRFHELLTETQALLGAFYFEDFFPSMGWMDRLTGVKGRLKKNFDEFDALYEQIIKEHLDDSGERRHDQQADIVDVLLGLQKDASHLTKEHIKGILTDIFLGGTETASATVTWAMAELAKKPGVMKKVQEEVRVSVGAKGKVEEDDLYRLRYLKAVVKETMRLHSPVPMLIPRESVRHSRIAGYDILPKTRVYINAWGIGRDPNSWEQPGEFYPDRFLNSPVDVKGQDFELIPFGSGRRICPAVNLGLVTIEFALANLLYCFDWELPAGLNREDIDMDEAPGLVTFKKSALNLVAVWHTMK